MRRFCRFGIPHLAVPVRAACLLPVEYGEPVPYSEFSIVSVFSAVQRTLVAGLSYRTQAPSFPSFPTFYAVNGPMRVEKISSFGRFGHEREA